MSGNEKLHGFFYVLLWILYTHSETPGDGCGHAVLGPESGVLSSKNYPRTYPNHTWCQWRIQVPAGRRVALKFGDLDVEAQSCQHSYVRIQRGGGGHGGEQGFETFCGSRKPPIDLHIDTNQLIVQFRSGTHISGRGFLLSYSTVQNRDLLTCLDKGAHFSKEPKYRKYCPAGCRGVAGDVSGDISQGYRHTSVLCKAAVHAGAIQDETGGWVSVETRKGQSHYPATRANGVQSKDGSLSDSLFTFISNECKKESALRPVAVNGSTWQQLSTWPADSSSSSSGSRPQTHAAAAADGTAASLGGEAERRAPSAAAVLWVAKQNAAPPWLQLDLGEKKRVTGIITMGSSWMKTHYYVKTYRIELKEKNRWRVWAQNNITDFEGNQDSLHQTRNNFHPSIVARYLRLIPLSWDQHVAMRVEVLGCTYVRANVSTQMMVETQPTKSKPALADTQPGPLHVDLVNMSSHQTLGTQPTKPKPLVPGQDTQPVPLHVDIVKLAIIIVPTLLSVVLLLTGICLFKILHKKQTKDHSYGSSEEKTGCWKQIKQPFARHQSTEFTISYSSDKEPIQNLYVVTSTMAEYQQPLMIGMGTMPRKGSTFRPMDTEASDGGGAGADPATQHYDFLQTANQYALPLTNQEPEYATPIIERHAFRNKDNFLPPAAAADVPGSSSSCYNVPGTMTAAAAVGKSPSFRAPEAGGAAYRKPGLGGGGGGGGSRGYQTPQVKRTDRCSSGQNSAGLLYDRPKVSQQGHGQGGERLDANASHAADYQQPPQAKPLVMESYSTPRDCVRKSPVSSAPPVAVGLLLHRPDPEGGYGGT